MAVINWILDALILTANVGAALLALYVAMEAFAYQRRRLAIWDEQQPMLGGMVGAVHAAIVLAMAAGFFWVTYWLAGFPTWMRWLAG